MLSYVFFSFSQGLILFFSWSVEDYSLSLRKFLILVDYEEENLPVRIERHWVDIYRTIIYVNWENCVRHVIMRPSPRECLPIATYWFVLRHGISYKIVLAVEFAVVSTGDGGDLFVEHRDFVGFETVG